MRYLLFFSMMVLPIFAVAQSYDFESIRELQYRGNGKIEIRQGERNRLEILSGYLENLALSSAGGVLKLEQRGALQIFLTVKDLEKIILSGNVQVDIDQLQGSDLVIDIEEKGAAFVEGTLTLNRLITTIHGYGQVNVQGNAKEQTVFIRGLGRYEGKKLETENTSVHIQGGGTASVQAMNKLDASVLGYGQILYVGEPHDVSRHIQGRGTIEGRKK